MKYVPALVILIAMVMLMAGAGRRGVRAGESIGIVIVIFLVLAALFAVIVRRAL